MKKRKKIFRSALALGLAAGLAASALQGIPARAASAGWQADAGGWWYLNADGSYPVNQWQQINGSWYYFTGSGYMDYGEYRDGCWLGTGGAWDPAFGNGGWHVNNSGWWYEDNGWYPANQWLWINGSCYYFTGSGYMDSGEYRNGCWVGADGAWNPAYANGAWHVNSTGWWYEDNGWYPVNQWLWINGRCYHFNQDGYMEVNAYRDGCWLGADGAWNGGSAGTWHAGSNGWWFGDNGWYPANQWLTINGVSYWFDGNGYWSGDTKAPALNTDPAQTQGGGDAGTTQVKSYTYQISPLLAPFNNYFLIKTDNPDPESFRFVDKSSKYQTGSSGAADITPVTTRFADVKYSNAGTGYVGGGYIAYGGDTDGGELVLQQKTRARNEYGYMSDTFQDTDVKVTVPALEDTADYLIQTYGGSGSFFDKMDRIQNGFSDICLYSGTYVLGEQKINEKNKNWGISTSPHVDQNFYIQDPYYREDSKSMLVSALFPFRYDSLGFPGMMADISSRLDSGSTWEWSSSYHYLINVTDGGTTKTYGGAGSGGGQGIRENQILYWYKFDQSGDDAANYRNLTWLSKANCQYGDLNVPEDKKENVLTWDDVKKTVGSGSYVKLIGLFSVFGASGSVYSYLYDDGIRGNTGNEGFASIGDLSNTWFDGRYFNDHEYIYTAQDAKNSSDQEISSVPFNFRNSVSYARKHPDDMSVPSVTFKDYKYKLPELSAGQSYCYNYGSVDLSQYYDADTGVWKGYTTFYYNSSKDAWVASICNNVQIRTKSDSRWSGYTYDNVSEDVQKKFTLTEDQLVNMGVDKNVNTLPSSGFIYDESAPAGTRFGK